MVVLATVAAGAVIAEYERTVRNGNVRSESRNYTLRNQLVTTSAAADAPTTTSAVEPYLESPGLAAHLGKLDANRVNGLVNGNEYGRGLFGGNELRCGNGLKS